MSNIKKFLFGFLVFFGLVAATYRREYFDYIEGLAVYKNFLGTGEFEVSVGNWTSYTDMAFTNGTGVSTGTDTITITGHGFVDGTKVLYQWDTIASIGGLTDSTEYYVRDATANTFKLASTLGGSAIDLTSTSGSSYYYFKPSAPTDGTGSVAIGSGLTIAPSTTCTLTTSSPGAGSGSLLITKDAAYRMGEGCSSAFTIDASMKSKQLAIDGLYLVGSGTFNAGTFSTDSDITVWVYDVTNSQRIPVSWQRLESNSTSVWGDYYATFPAASNSTSYRLILHQSYKNNAAYTLKWDSIKVSKQATSQGPPIGDWIDYTPTRSDSGGSWSNTSVTAKYRRVGTDAEVRIYISLTSSVTGTLLNYTTPCTIDTTKLPSSVVNGRAVYGHIDILDNDGGQYMGQVVGYTSTAVAPLVGVASNTYTNMSQLTATVPITFAASDSITMMFRVPCTGWNTSTSLSNIDTTREIIEHYSTDTATPVANASDTAIQWEDLIYSSHAAFTTSNGTFSAPASGYYDIDAQATLTSGGGWAAGEQMSLSLYKNGIFVRFFGTTFSMATHSTFMSVSGTTGVNLAAGETAQVRIYQNSGGSINIINTAGYNEVKFQRKGPQQRVAAQEPVLAIYTFNASSANTSYADAAYEINDYNLKIKDSHNAVTTGASWKFTAPYSSTYCLLAEFWWNNTTNIAQSQLVVYKNGVQHKFIDQRGSGTVAERLGGGLCLQLLGQEYIDVRAYQDDTASAARAAYTSSNAQVQIWSVGSY